MCSQVCNNQGKSILVVSHNVCSTARPAIARVAICHWSLQQCRKVRPHFSISPTPLPPSFLTAMFPCSTAGACNNTTFTLFCWAKRKLICPQIFHVQDIKQKKNCWGQTENLQTVIWAIRVCPRRPDFLLSSVLYKRRHLTDWENTQQSFPLMSRLVGGEEERLLFLKASVTDLQDNQC